MIMNDNFIILSIRAIQREGEKERVRKKRGQAREREEEILLLCFY